tara:strand:+ start:1386 stop:1865 length:480 start_codon:yes stop_codon:yes gene_type:complete
MNDLIGTIKREEVVKMEDKLVPRTYICATDNRLNYTFCKKEDIETNNNLPEVIDRSMIDYGIVVKKGEPETDDSVGTLDETRPLSYIGCISPEQGEMWYRTKYPDLPDDFYGIIARYTWGNPQTKKSIKNEVKKVKKNPRKPIPQGLSIMRGKFSVSFD